MRGAAASEARQGPRNPNTGNVTTAQKYPNGETTAQSSNGTKAVYNPHTGNAAVAQKNQNRLCVSRSALPAAMRSRTDETTVMSLQAGV